VVLRVGWRVATHRGGVGICGERWEHGARYGPLNEVAWCGLNSNNRAHDVGEKRVNGFRLFDMLGNAFEWVSDWYDEKSYQENPAIDPVGLRRVNFGFYGGGAWDSPERSIRVSFRVRRDRNDRSANGGFRCVQEAVAP